MDSAAALIDQLSRMPNLRHVYLESICSVVCDGLGADGRPLRAQTFFLKGTAIDREFEREVLAYILGPREVGKARPLFSEHFAVPTEDDLPHSRLTRYVYPEAR